MSKSSALLLFGEKDITRIMQVWHFPRLNPIMCKIVRHSKILSTCIDIAALLIAWVKTKENNWLAHSTVYYH